MKPEEIVQILTEHSKWFADSKTGQKANLTGADLTGSNLRYAYLTGANLRYANLRYANLTDAYLTGAYLTKTKFLLADLKKYDLYDKYDFSKSELIVISPSKVWKELNE